MKLTRLIALIFITIILKTEAQQNWASVPCFTLDQFDNIGRLQLNTAHNEIILIPNYSYKICGSTYKGLFAYNGNTFHDMDLGIEAQDPNPYLGSVRVRNCVEYNGKAIVTGAFSTVGSDTLYSKSVALWDGIKWSNFPHNLWPNASTYTVYVGFSEILRDNGKLWMFAGYDSTGNHFKSKPVLYDGSNFTPIPPVPVSVQSAISRAIRYKNKIIVTGNFYDFPSYKFNKLAQFDGTSWSEMGTGAIGSLTGVAELAVFNDTLYIAGNFAKSAGNAGNYIMKWDGNQLTDAGFGSWCGYGPVSKLINYRNRLYAFGGFNCAIGKKAFGVAYYENGKWTVPQDSINNGVYDAVLYNDAIYIGGDFKSINKDTTIRKFAKLLCPDFDASTGCLSGLKDNYKNSLNLKVFPNPVNNKLNIETDYSIKIEHITLTNALGQLMFNTVNFENKLTLDISYLPSGIYFLRAENKQGQSVFKVIKE